jgi:succinyl-diaminopimelate desuccinylase
VHAGDNVNSVPDRAEVTIDFRTVPGLTHAQLSEMMMPNIDSKSDLLTLLSLDPVWSDPSSPWVREVCEIAGEPRWRTTSYFTDAAVLSPALGAPPTIVIGPGEPTMAHKTDEYCDLGRIVEAVEIYKKIMSSWLENESTQCVHVIR